MDVTQSLLVAMMFIMLLSLGIMNILMGLASLLQHRGKIRTHWIPTSWHILLLLEMFDLFWHTLDILAVEDWNFISFVYTTTGPILLFLATSLLLPNVADESAGDNLEQYFTTARPFYGTLTVYMAWLIGIDFVLTDASFTVVDGVTIVEGVLFVVLAVSQQVRLHGILTGVFWVVIVSLSVAQAMGAAS